MTPQMATGDGRLHRNLVESSRQLFELDPGAALESTPEWLFGAGTATHPAISNVAFRAEDAADPDDFLSRAIEFFGERGRGFSIWVRDLPEDRDLRAAAERRGLREFFSMPEMVLSDRAEERPFPDGFELRRLTSAAEAGHYWQVAAAAYAELGFPAEVFSHYEDHSGLVAENATAFLAYEGDRPVAIALTIISDGVAGIYWVGSIAEVRGRGLGRALTAAATNAGFDLGAEVASLQASRMGEGVYRAMGYVKAYDYRLMSRQVGAS